MKRNEIMNVFNELCVRLGLENNPPVLLVGKDAKKFIKNHYSPKNTPRVNGMFLYENLDEKYIESNNIDKRCIETGVVCLVKIKKSTLIHEMKHAHQLNKNHSYMYLESNEKLKKAYKKAYPYYPSEKGAFTYTINQLERYSDSIYRYHMNDGEVLKYILNYWKIAQAKSSHLLYKTKYKMLLVQYWLGYRKMIKEQILHD